MVWLAAAGAALWGLRARPWATPFFRPSKLIEPDILNASAPALSYLLMARRLEGAIERNGLQLRALARDVYLVQIGLVAGVVAIFAAALLSLAKAIF